MKKYLLILILIPAIASAGITDKLRAVVAKKNSVSAPAWRNDTDVVFAWQASNGTTAYAGNTPISGSQTNGAIGVNQGFTSMEISSTTAEDYIVWTQTSNQYVTNASAGTVCLKVWTTNADSTNRQTLFWADNDGTDEFGAVYAQNANFFGYWIDNGAVQITVDDTTRGDWTTYAYSWQTPNDVTPGDHITNGGESSSPWTDGWDAAGADAEEVVTVTNGVIKIYAGNPYSKTTVTQDGVCDADEPKYVQKIAVTTTYQTDCSGLTGW